MARKPRKTTTRKPYRRKPGRTVPAPGAETVPAPVDPYYPPPPAPPPKEPPRYGFECPRCACPLFRVGRTWGIRGAVRRLRICTHCGWETRTMETFAG